MDKTEGVLPQLVDDTADTTELHLYGAVYFLKGKGRVHDKAIVAYFRGRIESGEVKI